MTTIQPSPIRMSVGTTDSGWRTSATMTGGAQDTNGPKNGIIWSRPAATEVRTASGRPSSSVRPEGDEEVDEAHQRLAAQEPAERARDRRLEQAGLLRVARRDDPEQEGQDHVAVEDHVDRQEEDDQHRADHAQARDRDLLERRDERAGDLVEVAEGRLGLGHEVDLAETRASSARPATARGSSGRFDLMSGSRVAKSAMEVASAPAARTTRTTRITTTAV